MIYRLILDHTHGILPKFTKIWSGVLGIDISDEEWHKTFLFTHKSSISSYTQEKNYKLLSRWYKVPTNIKVIKVKVPLCHRRLLEMSLGERHLSQYLVGMHRDLPVLVTDFSIFHRNI